jgi:HlyD family secretion protein
MCFNWVILLRKLANPARKPLTLLTRSKQRWWILAVVGVTGFAAWQRFKPKPPPPAEVNIVRGVSALGRLTPEGGLIALSVPGGAGGFSNDVVERWFVGEGQPIRKGQLLAQMSSYRQLKASLLQAETNFEASKILLPFLEIGQTRGGVLLKEGAISEEDLGKSIASVETRKANIQSAEAGVQIARRQLETSQIKSPIDGTLIRIFSAPGMKETDEGLATIGQTNSMEAWAQVYQADINKLRLNQKASIRAESGGFSGSLRGKLKAIIANVSSRDLFATNNNNNVNARVILTKLSIDPEDMEKVKRLSGLNVIVQFEP